MFHVISQGAARGETHVFRLIAVCNLAESIYPMAASRGRRTGRVGANGPVCNRQSSDKPKRGLTSSFDRRNAVKVSGQDLNPPDNTRSSRPETVTRSSPIGGSARYYARERLIHTVESAYVKKLSSVRYRSLFASWIISETALAMCRVWPSEHAQGDPGCDDCCPAYPERPFAALGLGFFLRLRASGPVIRLHHTASGVARGNIDCKPWYAGRYSSLVRRTSLGSDWHFAGNRLSIRLLAFYTRVMT